MSAHHLKLNLDKTKLPSRKGISHPWPLYQHWELCGVPGSDCKEPGCDTRWPAVLHHQHYCNNPLLQILYHIRTIRPFLTQEAAQVLAGVPACIIRPLQLFQNSAALLVQLIQVVPLYTAPLPPALASGGRWNLIEDTGTCLLCCSGSSYIQDMVKPHTPAHPLHSATAIQLATPSLRGGPSYHSSKSHLFPVPAPQWAPQGYQVSRNSTHLQTENSSVQTTPWHMKIK